MLNIFSSKTVKIWINTLETVTTFYNFTVNKTKHIYLISMRTCRPIQCSVVLYFLFLVFCFAGEQKCSSSQPDQYCNFLLDQPRLINVCVSANTPVHLQEPPSPNYTFISTTTDHANGDFFSGQLRTSRNAVRVQSSLVLVYSKILKCLEYTETFT